jgi:hypothetical protein
MRLTVPHYFDFGGDRARVGRRLESASAWDTLRDTDGPFGLPSTRAEWEAIAADAGTAARSEDVVRVARELGARRLCSYGVGIGALELNVARRAPELDLVCTDYASQTVARLATLFPEAEVLRHDLLEDEPVDADLHLLHRVDTEFSDADLRRVLARFGRPVLFVPAAFLDVRLLARELYVRVARRGATRAGWLRSESAFHALWGDAREAAEARIGDARAYLLTSGRRA